MIDSHHELLYQKQSKKNKLALEIDQNADKLKQVQMQDIFS